MDPIIGVVQIEKGDRQVGFLEQVTSLLNNGYIPFSTTDVTLNGASLDYVTVTHYFYKPRT